MRNAESSVKQEGRKTNRIRTNVELSEHFAEYPRNARGTPPRSPRKGWSGRNYIFHLTNPLFRFPSTLRYAISQACIMSTTLLLLNDSVTFQFRTFHSTRARISRRPRLSAYFSLFMILQSRYYIIPRCFSEAAFVSRILT